MRKQGKILMACLLLAALLLTACGGKENTNVPPQTDPQPQTDQPSAPQPQEPDFSQFDDQFVTCPTDENLAVACISCNGGSYLVYRRYTDPEAGEAVYGASVGYLHGENHYREPIWSPNGEIVQYLELEEDQGEGAYYDVVFHKSALDKGEEPICCNVRVYREYYGTIQHEYYGVTPNIQWFADSNRLLIASRPVVIYNCAEDSYTWVSQDTPTSPGPPFVSTDKDAKSMEASLSPDEKYIAYELIDDGGMNLMLYEIATGERTKIGFLRGHEYGRWEGEKPQWVSATEIQWRDSSYTL